MTFRTGWTRTFVVVSGFTLVAAGMIPGQASAHAGVAPVGQRPTCRAGAGTGGSRCASQDHRASVRTGALASVPHAQQVAQALARTLIVGSGDTADAAPPLDIDPDEPLTNLGTILANAGYGVDIDDSSTLPRSLEQYKAVWFISTDPLTASEETQLEAFVGRGGSLYLTGAGAGPCCAALNEADTSVADALLTIPDVQVGSQIYADEPNEPETVNASAIDDVAVIPNGLSSWTPGAPGALSGIASENQLTTTTFDTVPEPTGAVWDASDMLSGKGRLAILTDINWLETEFWDQTTATQMALNLERFLMAALPIPAVGNSHWAGLAAKANGVQDVNGEWTVPSVNCAEDAKASALRIWVGIDGFGNTEIANAGVGITCASPQANPCYYLFTEVHPSNETQVTGCGGVSPGDDVQVDVANNPFGSSRFLATITVNGSVVDGQPFTLSERTRRDQSAECVVELPSGVVGPPTPALYKELANFTPVTFTDCAATATANAGTTPDSEQLSMGSDGAFKVSALALGGIIAPLATTATPTYPALTWSVNWLAS